MYFRGFVLYGQQQIYKEEGPDGDGTDGRGPTTVPLQSNRRPQWVNSTLGKISQYYTWNVMKEDVADYLSMKSSTL